MLWFFMLVNYIYSVLKFFILEMNVSETNNLLFKNIKLRIEIKKK